MKAKDFDKEFAEGQEDIVDDLALSSVRRVNQEQSQPSAYSAYLVDVQDYEFMQRRLELLEGLSRGERAVLEGRTDSQSEAKEKMSKWLK